MGGVQGQAADDPDDAEGPVLSIDQEPVSISTCKRASPRVISSPDCNRTPRGPAGTVIVAPFLRTLVPCALRSSQSRYSSGLAEQSICAWCLETLRFGSPARSSKATWF